MGWDKEEEQEGREKISRRGARVCGAHAAPAKRKEEESGEVSRKEEKCRGTEGSTPGPAAWKEMRHSTEGELEWNGVRFKRCVCVRACVSGPPVSICVVTALFRRCRPSS